MLISDADMASGEGTQVARDRHALPQQMHPLLADQKVYCPTVRLPMAPADMPLTWHTGGPQRARAYGAASLGLHAAAVAGGAAAGAGRAAGLLGDLHGRVRQPAAQHRRRRGPWRRLRQLSLRPRLQRERGRPPRVAAAAAVPQLRRRPQLHAGAPVF